MENVDSGKGCNRAMNMPMELLTERLNKLIQAMPSSGLTLGNLLHLAGPDGLMLLVALLSLIFIIPVSVPGVSTVFGSLILLISISRLINRELWMPASFQRRIIPTDKLLPVFSRAFVWLRRLEKISEPRRLQWLAAGGLIGAFNNCALILGALLLMAPFGLIPFSNTAPGVALLCFSIGIVQKDGVCIVLGHVANLLTLIYFSVLIGGGGLAISDILQRVSS